MVDVSSYADVERAAADARKRAPGLHILVNSAGITGPTVPVKDFPLDGWRSVIDVNLTGTFHCCRAVVPAMLEAGYGRIVNVASVAGKEGNPNASAYSASKAALNQLARVAALEWGGDGIRVNVLHPNAVFDTGIWSDEVLAARAAHYGISVEVYRRRNVLRTDVTSRDVADLAAAMCGPLFGKTTGAQVPVDGGNERVV